MSVCLMSVRKIWVENAEILTLSKHVNTQNLVLFKAGNELDLPVKYPMINL